MAGNHAVGGYDANFSPALNDDYACCICTMAFRDPQQLPCGHQYCKSCLENCTKTQEGLIVCPQDRQSVDMDNVFPDKAIERKVLALTVRCNNVANGCDWSDELRALQEHIDVCTFENIPCSNDGCTASHQRRHLEDHVLNKCEFRIFECSHCEENYIQKDEKGHLESCIMFPIKCDGCGETFPRNEMGSHHKSCQLAVLSCNFQYLGCDYAGTKDQRLGHERDENAAHLNFAMEKIRLLQDKTDTLQADLQSANETIQLLESKSGLVTFVWKIKEYNRKLQEARATNACVVSEHFQTSRFGYQVRLRAFLNGTNAGRGTHIAIYFEVIKGEFDAILKWPFSYQHYKIVLLHLADETKNKIHTFYPKVPVDTSSSNSESSDSNNSNASARPTPERRTNVGYGRSVTPVPERSSTRTFGNSDIISHEDISNNGYVVDDTIYVKLEIKTDF